MNVSSHRDASADIQAHGGCLAVGWVSALLSPTARALALGVPLGVSLCQPPQSRAVCVVLRTGTAPPSPLQSPTNPRKDQVPASQVGSCLGRGFLISCSRRNLGMLPSNPAWGNRVHVAGVGILFPISTLLCRQDLSVLPQFPQGQVLHLRRNRSAMGLCQTLCRGKALAPGCNQGGHGHRRPPHPLWKGRAE